MPGPTLRQVFVDALETALLASLGLLGGCGGSVATKDHSDSGTMSQTSVDASSSDAAGDSSDAAGDATSGSPEAQAPPSSCLDVLHRNPAAVSGPYSITVQGNAVTVHCDMALAGGGWTAFFVNRLGSSNVFAHFDSTSDAAAPADDCPDPEKQCLRHLPSTVDLNTSFAAECGSDALGFAVNTNVIDYFAHGVSSEWQPLTGQVSLGGNPNLSFGSNIWTGDGVSNEGWILSANDMDPTFTTHTFASSYNSDSSGWDYCNGVSYNGASGEPPMVYLLYR